MLNSNLNFDADTLACALVLTGKATPTRAELTAALGELYPAGNGPAVPELLAAGWLEATIDGRGLRVPPLSLAEQDARLAEAAPELVLKLNTTPAAPLAEQDARLAAHESKNALVPKGVTEPGTPSLPAAHEIKSELVPPEVKNPVGGKLPPAASLKMSYYKGPINNKWPHANTTPGQLHQVITRPPRYLRERAAATRAAFAAHGKKHPAYVALKTQLDYFTAAGTFPPGHRQAADILTRSGLLILDFDDLPDVAAARAALLADAWAAPDLVLLFVSPAGNGLKALVQTDPTAAHLDNFRAWADYLGRTYAALGLAPDEAGKDVCRACFLSRDPDAWLAPAYAA